MTNVIPIQAHLRIPKTNRSEDDPTIIIATQAETYRQQALNLISLEPDSENYRLAIAMARIAAALPRNNLCCLVSTLDEAKDFDLLCVEVEIARAVHEVENLRNRRQALIEGNAWWQSPTQKRMVNDANRRWDEYRELVQMLACRPARSATQAERKRRIIGRVWLGAEGEWYDRLRNGVAADDAWLARNFPKRARKKRTA